MSITLSALQKQRRDTAANWTAENPTLLAGEIGVESDTGYWKIGDGATAWTSLGYVTGTQLSAYPIVDTDIAAAAEIAVSKLADGAARQLLQTDAAGTGVEWTDDIDVPGTLDVTGAATFDDDVTIQGDLTVNGTTTTIDTTTLVVEDKNIEIGKVATPTDVTADGGGITLKGSTDKTINWVDATDAWTLSEHVDIASAKEYRIAGTKVLDATSLGSNVLITSANITDGTIVNADVNTSAAIAGTKISPDFGSQNVTTTGTATAAALIPSGSSVPTNGVYLPSANNVAISTNGTGRLFVDGSGRLLINASSSTNVNTATFQGNSALGTGTGIVNIALGNTTPGTSDQLGRLQFTDSGHNSAAEVIGQRDGGTWNTSTSRPTSLIFTTTSNGAASTTERMRLDSSGRLGIGTTSAPAGGSIKTVIDGSSGGGLELVYNNNGGGALIPSSGGGLQFYTHTGAVGSESYSERARIDSSGRLLVGTSSARANFFNSTASSIFQVEGNLSGGSQGQAISHVYGENAALGGPYFIFGKHRSGSIGGTTLVANNDQLGAISFAGADGTEFVEGARIQAFVDGAPGADDMPGRLVFSVTRDGQSSPSEAMRITSAGNVLIGTNDTTSVAKFWVNGLGGLDHCARFQGTPSSGSLAQFVDLNTSGTHRAALFVKNFNEVGTITMTTSATAYNTSSDYRLKENIVPLTGASARLNQLQVHRFNFIAEPSKTVDGFLAHEAQAVVPECVTGIKDEVDDKGNPVYQGIDQSKLVPLLTAALQEALAEIESLKARVTALEP